jgi:hypothetical protein
MLWTFLNPKNYNYFESNFKHLKINKFLLWFLNIYYSIMIWNWKWKKMLLLISSKYSYFKPIFNYTRKGLWKGIIICQNCDTLMCFLPCIIVASELKMDFLYNNHSYDILGARMLWKPNEARILKNFIEF